MSRQQVLEELRAESKELTARMTEIDRLLSAKRTELDAVEAEQSRTGLRHGAVLSAIRALERLEPAVEA